MMSPGIKPQVECNDCLARCVGGESCCMVNYTANAAGFIGLTPLFPGKVIPIDLGKIEGNKLLSKDGAYMAGLGEAKPGYDLDCCSCTCCFGGQGCVRQSIQGEGTKRA